MKIFAIIISCIISITATAQEIAITFDDAPMGDGPVFSGSQRASKIIEALKKHKVDQVAFFVVTSHIDSTGLQRLKAYSKAGHLLANHSHSHNWIRSMGTGNYIRDIQKADSILKATLPYKPWYRYPFLDEGRKVSSRDSIRDALAEMSLMNAYVTVDNYDWYLAGALRKAVRENKKVNYNLMKAVYLEHVWNSIQFYDSIGQQVLNRSPKHVLLLHENDLSALFIGDLIQLLKDKGWKIISPEEAYTDPICGEVPDVLFNGQGRVGSIAYAKGWKPEQLIQQSEDESYLDKLLESRKVFEK